MKVQHRHVLVGLLVAAAAGVAAVAATVATAAGPSINAGPQAGIVWTHGQQTAAGHAAHTRSPNLIYHGGPVITTTARVHPIFWGTSWTTSGTSDTEKELAGILDFYGGVGGTAYIGTNGEYTDSSGVHVTSGVSKVDYKIDTSAAPTHAPQTSTILAEVARAYPNLQAGDYYPVYIDQPRGHAGYCAWHSAGNVNGVEVQFGFFFKLDGDPGCDPQGGDSSDPEGLQALGNVSGHELSEMLTDPQLNAWYDSQGEENADKCAWTFGPSLISFGGHQWKIQGNWSNAAYDAGQGYIYNGSVVQGCIDGSSTSSTGKHGK